LLIDFLALSIVIFNQYSERGDKVSTTTILIIVIVLIVLFGGFGYSRYRR